MGAELLSKSFAPKPIDKPQKRDYNEIVREQMFSFFFAKICVVQKRWRVRRLES